MCSRTRRSAAISPSDVEALAILDELGARFGIAPTLGRCFALETRTRVRRAWFDQFLYFYVISR